MPDLRLIADEIIVELNAVARDIDHYEYGLPIYGPEDYERLIAVVLPILDRLHAEQPLLTQQAVKGGAQ